MPYKVQFVGLICFVKHEKIIRALMPDGTNPDQGIPKHIPFICIANPDIDEGGTTWPASQRISLGDILTVFWWTTRSQINVEGADKAGTLKTYDQDSRLPRLSLYPNHVKIDPNTAPAIADIPIRQGKLEAFRLPKSPDDGKGPLISQLDIPHDQAITITVTPNDQSASYTLKLFPATEIAFVHVSQEDVQNVLSEEIRRVMRASFEPAASASGSSTARTSTLVNDNHFELYGTLAVPKVDLGSPGPTPLGFPDSKSTHVLFQSGPIGTTPRCSNTGCCSS